MLLRRLIGNMLVDKTCPHCENSDRDFENGPCVCVSVMQSKCATPMWRINTFNLILVLRISLQHTVITQFISRGSPTIVCSWLFIQLYCSRITLKIKIKSIHGFTVTHPWVPVRSIQQKGLELERVGAGFTLTLSPTPTLNQTPTLTLAPTQMQP